MWCWKGMKGNKRDRLDWRHAWVQLPVKSVTWTLLARFCISFPCEGHGSWQPCYLQQLGCWGRKMNSGHGGCRQRTQTMWNVLINKSAAFIPSTRLLGKKWLGLFSDHRLSLHFLSLKSQVVLLCIYNTNVLQKSIKMSDFLLFLSCHYYIKQLCKFSTLENEGVWCFLISPSVTRRLYRARSHRC